LQTFVTETSQTAGTSRPTHRFTLVTSLSAVLAADTSPP